MKNTSKALLILVFALCCEAMISCQSSGKAEERSATANPEMIKTTPGKKLFMDVHNLGAGNVTFEAVQEAHKKDLQVQGKHDVSFLKYWVDESSGKVYCLAEAHHAEALTTTHKEAHGLVPDFIHEVTHGIEAEAKSGKNLYWDIHILGAGNVTAEAVAEAHEKDLQTQNNFGVNFINYWVDETNGVVMCLSEAPDSTAVVKTHKHAHGLLPDRVGKVQQGE